MSGAMRRSLSVLAAASAAPSTHRIVADVDAFDLLAPVLGLQSQLTFPASRRPTRTPLAHQECCGNYGNPPAARGSTFGRRGQKRSGWIVRPG
jgi:hypothetical protein